MGTVIHRSNFKPENYSSKNHSCLANTSHSCTLFLKTTRRWLVLVLGPKHTKRCASCVKNGTNASDVYCAHIAFFTGVHNAIRKKIKTGSIFLHITRCISVSCVVLWVIYDANCAHTAQKKNANADAHRKMCFGLKPWPHQARSRPRFRVALVLSLVNSIVVTTPRTRIPDAHTRYRSLFWEMQKQL